MPFDDLTGGSGFVSNEDGANATLNVSMSEDSARNLWDVQAAIQQIAMDFQTAVRAASDFSSYLISIRETSQTIKMPSLGMEGGEGGNMTYPGGRVDRGSVPMLQGEEGMSDRVAEMEENSSGVSGGATTSRATNARPVDPGGLINQMTTAAWMMQGMTGGGHGRQQHQGAAQLHGNPYHPLAMGPGGGGGGGVPGGVGVFNQGRQAAQQFLRGGGLGGAAAMLTGLGAVGAVGYAGYQLVDAGLETYAQGRSMAISTNNSDLGAVWGIGQRAGQAGMALSPFVSQEEAAQIYNTAIDQGWASRRGGLPQGSFGQAVNFMYDAAKDYNMDPAMSSQLLQKSSVGAGESVIALSEQLLSLKKNLDGTGISMTAAVQNFTDLNSMFITMGASAPASSNLSGGIIKAFAGNTYLSTEGAATTQGIFGSQQMQNILGGLTGSHPGAIYADGHTQATTQAMDKLIKNMANQALSMKGDEATKVAMFAQSMSALTGTNISQEYARNLLMESGANPDLFTQGMKDQIAAGKLGPQQHQNGFQAWWHGLDDTGGWASTQTGNGQSVSDQEANSSLINSYENYSPEINTLLSSSDLTNTILYGPDGKPVMDNGNRVAGANIAKWFNDNSNYSKFSDAKNGYYIQDAGGTKYNASNIGTGGDISSSNTTSGDSTSGNTVFITLSPQAKMWFDTNKDQLHLSTGKN